MSDEQTEVKDQVNNNTDEIVDELERDFAEFEKSKSENSVEELKPVVSPEADIFDDEISEADNFKVQLFMSLMFALLDGLHVFIYGFISKYKITREDIALEESDREGLAMYFKTKKVVDMINRLPVEVIGFVHMEYMYFNKFQDFNQKMQALELAQGKDQEEEEEEEEEQEPKKAAPKKRPKKKKSVKKKAAKKEAPKEAQE